jgi:5-methylcytosine-specific restriction endonuclease McrA
MRNRNAMIQHQRGMSERLLTMAVKQMFQHLTHYGQSEEQAEARVRELVDAALRECKATTALKRYAARPDSHLHSLHNTGAEHPNWKGGINADYYRRVGFEAHGKACQRCGSTRHLNVHHKNEDRYDSDPQNLEVLCRSCHNKAHSLGGRHGRRVAQEV